MTTDLNTLLTALYVRSTTKSEEPGASVDRTCPNGPGYHKRLKYALPLLKRMIRELAMDSDFCTDTVWIADSTPVPCGMSRATVQRSDMAGWAGYGYCASHSRFFWGLRLYLVSTPTGMPIMWALANPKIGEREVLTAILEIDADLVARREGILLITDKGFASRPFEADLDTQGIELLRPSLKREKRRYGADAEEGPTADRVGQRHPQRAA